MIVEDGQQEKVKEILDELQKGSATDLSKWKFVFGNKAAINALFSSFKTDVSLNDKASNSTVFIIDRKKNCVEETMTKK